MKTNGLHTAVEEMAYTIGESCPWYTTGTSSLWMVEGLSPGTSHRFTVLYLGTPEAVPALEIFSHGSRGTDN